MNEFRWTFTDHGKRPVLDCLLKGRKLPKQFSFKSQTKSRSKLVLNVAYDAIRFDPDKGLAVLIYRGKDLATCPLPKLLPGESLTIANLQGLTELTLS